MPDNPSQLRNAIDAGTTGDKVAFPDPAAAPLGTDAEAGGKPPTAGEVALDGASLPRRSKPRLSRDQAGIPTYLAVASAVCLAILAAVALT